MGSRSPRTYRRWMPRLRPAMVLHRIHAARHERVAAQHAPQRHRSALQDPEPLHGFDRVLRAGWNVSAGGRQHGRDQPLVRVQNLDGHLLHRLFFSRGRRGVSLAATPLPCCTAANARSISASSFGRSKAMADFLGLITTSTFALSGPKFFRSASRIRRLIRLRVTAPPSTFPTVSPTRGPSPDSRCKKKTVRLGKKGPPPC